MKLLGSVRLTFFVDKSEFPTAYKYMLESKGYREEIKKNIKSLISEAETSIFAMDKDSFHIMIDFSLSLNEDFNLDEYDKKLRNYFKSFENQLTFQD